MKKKETGKFMIIFIIMFLIVLILTRVTTTKQDRIESNNTKTAITTH